MTRFGENLQNFKCNSQSFEGSFRHWQNFEPNLGNTDAIGQIFHVLNGQILNKEYTHLVTLD